MTKHTSGPWEMGPIIAGEDIFILADNRKAAIARASNLETYANTFEKLRPLAAECEANARLIAAAPDMLDALHHCYNIVSTGILHQSSLSKDGIIELLKDAQEAAHTAIAKATGG